MTQIESISLIIWKNLFQDASNPFHLRTIWDWEEQFGPGDIALFHNPLYLLEKSAPPEPTFKSGILAVSAGLSSLEVWLQCYCRWVPMLELIGGGRPQVNFQVRLLAEQIVELKAKVEAYARGENPDWVPPYNFSEELSFTCDSALLKNRLQSNPSSFFPFVHHSAHPGDILLNTSFLGDEDELDECIHVSNLTLSTAV
jgi:Myotubularin-associated protein